MNYGLVGWGRPLHGALIFLRPSRYYAFLNWRTEYDTLSVARLDVPLDASEEIRFGPPVFAFAPASEKRESFSHAIISVRSTRYYFGYFNGTVGMVVQALEWIAMQTGIDLCA